jgi:hypothetical protein
VAARQCPNCLAMVPAGQIAAHSYDLVCPGCQRPLEISDFSRNLAVLIALAAAMLVWVAASKRFSSDTSALGWIMPILYSYLTLGIVAPLLLILLADLRQKSEVAAPGLHEAPAHHSSH